MADINLVGNYTYASFEFHPTRQARAHQATSGSVEIVEPAGAGSSIFDGATTTLAPTSAGGPAVGALPRIWPAGGANIALFGNYVASLVVTTGTADGAKLTSEVEQTQHPALTHSHA